MYYDGKEVYSKLMTGETPQLAPIVTQVEALIRERKLSRGEDPGPALSGPAAPGAPAAAAGKGKGKGAGKGGAKDLDEVEAEESAELRRHAA